MVTPGRAVAPLKTALLRMNGVREAWSPIRRRLLHAEYVQRRESYRRRAADAGLRYDEAQVSPRALERLARRGYVPEERRLGDIHTFAFIPRSAWHSALYPDLQELGPVSEYDYVAEGYDLGAFLNGDTDGRKLMNRAFVDGVCRAHAQRAIDWIFLYASGAEVLAETLRELRDRIGVPMVAMCLDDKQSWIGAPIGTQRSGMIDLAQWFDIAWTSATVATEWYLVEGGNPVYLPEGFDRSVYRPLSVARDIPVSFIGEAYGFRQSLIGFLRQRGVPVSTFGGGWGTSRIWGEEQVAMINRSRINLGHGGIGYSEQLTNVKTRDFEIPGTGGGLYITTFNPDLARHFVVGSEIVCYRSLEEAVELISYFLTHADEADAIAAAARRRCLDQHRWFHRYRRILELLSIVSPGRES